jgi:hypothetical protein
LLSCHADELTDDGRRRLVRHGHLPEREIMTGIGAIAVRCPRVRDRGGEGFRSACHRLLLFTTFSIRPLIFLRNHPISVYYFSKLRVRLLRTRRERPCGCCAAEQRDEFASSQLIEEHSVPY